MSTDWAWEEWGRRDPYFGVITNPKFRSNALTDEAKKEFFRSGQVHADFVMQMIHRNIEPAFAPASILDFGCGVGRLLIPFAKIAAAVIGLDVSPSMLAEARRNCDANALGNVTLVVSDDELSGVEATYDLIHSFIVFQHIPPDRGRELFRKLLGRLKPGGVGAVHFSYSKSYFAASHGAPPKSTPIKPAVEKSGRQPAPLPLGVDPEMQMNTYDLNEILFVMQDSNIHRLHVEFTDHGGEFGVFLFFQKISATR